MHANFHGPRFAIRINELMAGWCALRLQQVKDGLAPDYQFIFDGRSIRLSPAVIQRGNDLCIQVRDRHSGQVFEVIANVTTSGIHLPADLLQKYVAERVSTSGVVAGEIPRTGVAPS